MAEHEKLEMETIMKYYDTAKDLTDRGDRSTAKEYYNLCIQAAQKSREIKLESKSPDKPTMSDVLALAYNNLGWLKYLQVDFTGAVEDYTKALQHCPKLAVAYYNRGLIHYRLGRFDQAIIDQQECLKINPDFTSAQDCLKQSLEDKETQLKRELECQ